MKLQTAVLQATKQQTIYELNDGSLVLDERSTIKGVRLRVLFRLMLNSIIKPVKHLICQVPLANRFAILQRLYAEPTGDGECRYLHINHEL
jgi:hypothetical protein